MKLDESVSGLAGRYAGLGRELAGPDCPEQVLLALAHAAVREVPGAEFASITRSAADTFTTVAATDDLAHRVDRIQYQAAGGPCIDAVLRDAVCRADDLRTDDRWPMFGPRAFETGGIVSMLSIRLHIEDGAGLAASLNMYSTEVAAFDDAALAIGLQLATQGTLATAILSAREARRSARELGRLAEISQVLSSTLDEYEAVRRVARLVVPQLADVGIVDLLTADGRLERVAGVPADGVRVQLDELLARPEVQHRRTDSRTMALVSSGHTSHLCRAQIMDPDGVFDEPSRFLLGNLNALDMLVVPMKARQHVLGVMALIRLEGSQLYTGEEIALAEDIGRRAGLALDNARLYHREAAASATLQRALRPQLPPSGAVRAAARYRPAAARLDVGGDWYDLFEAPGELGIALIVGDVAGHDLQAASAMASIRNLLRAIAVTRADCPEQIMSTVDHSLAALHVQGTASCVLMNARPEGAAKWGLSWTSAGHPPPVLIPPCGDVVALDGVHGPILGTRTAPVRSSGRLTVPAGSTVLLYTDGLIEVPDEDFDVGLLRLRHAATGLRHVADDPEAFGDALLQRLPPSPNDDTVVLVCHLPTT